MKTEIQINRLTSSDSNAFKDLVLLFNEVFEMQVSSKLKIEDLQSLLDKPDFIVLAALKEDEVIGGLTAYELPMYRGNYSEVFIYDVGVKPSFQRIGVGKMLISALKELCNAKNIREIFVSAFLEDEHALAFYRSTGANEEQVVHFNYPLKV